MSIFCDKTGVVFTPVGTCYKGIGVQTTKYESGTTLLRLKEKYHFHAVSIEAYTLLPTFLEVVNGNLDDFGPRLWIGSSECSNVPQQYFGLFIC